MSYNLLFDTDFNHNRWEYINCSYENGILTSTKNIFGICQEVVLADITKLYLRFNYNILNSSISKVTIGIQNSDRLFINNKTPTSNKNSLISIVESTQLEKIKVHLIFESKKNINKVVIKEPLLCDLNRLHKSTWLKFILDKTIKFRNGLSYKNVLEYSEVEPEIFNLEKAKIGSIISTLQDKQFKIDAKLIKGKKYLIKLDYKEINNLGNINITYGIFRSVKINNEQLYLVFKADETNDLIINIKPNEVLPYQVNLKHIMILEVEGLGIDKDDIPYLPFV